MTGPEKHKNKGLVVDIFQAKEATNGLVVYRHFYGEVEQPSPFLAPSTVAAFAEQIGFVKVSEAESGKIWWMQPFLWVSRGHHLQLFGETHTDFIGLLFAKGLSEKQKEIALETGLRALNIIGFRCRKLKLNSPDTVLLLKVLAQIGLTAYSLPYISSPIATYQLDDEAGFKKIFSKSTIRNLHNRLQKQAAVEFEVIEENGEQVNNWLDDYYLLHEWRWSSTPTPSRFLHQQEKLDFKKRVSASLADHVAVLFSLKVDGSRQALVYALKAGNRLIYHQITNGQDPALYKFSIFKILIKHIGEWMRERQYEILDFGIGGETYKLEFATEFEQVAEIYAAKNKGLVAFKGAVKKYYLSHKQVQQRYLKARESFNIIKAKIRHSTKRSKQLAKHILADPIQYLKKAVSILTGKRTYFFQMVGAPIAPQQGLLFGKPSIEAILHFYEEELLTNPGMRGRYIGIYQTKEKLPWAIFRSNDEIACMGWSANATGTDVLPEATAKEDCVVLSDFLTSKKERGKGLYPQLLKHIAATFPDKVLTIYTADWNRPSQKGIQKAGFQRFR